MLHFNRIFRIISTINTSNQGNTRYFDSLAPHPEVTGQRIGGKMLVELAKNPLSHEDIAGLSKVHIVDPGMKLREIRHRQIGHVD